MALVPYSEGFENPAFTAGSSSGWNSYDSLMSSVPSGTNGIVSRSGSRHLEITPPSSGDTGIYTYLGGAQNAFKSGYTISLCVYIDVNDPQVALGTYGWDLSAASNRPSGSHLRDFVFHAATNGLGQVMIGASNNTSFNPQLVSNSVPVTSSGWYQFEWRFRDVGTGSLAVDMTVHNQLRDLVFSTTRNTPSDAILSEVGGHRYLWFTFATPAHLAIDNARTDFLWDNAESLDLSGTYRVPNSGIAMASTSSSSDRVSASSRSGTALRENSFTPFSDAIKPPASHVMDIDDIEAFSFELDMGPVTDYSDRGAIFRSGLAQQDISSVVSSGMSPECVAVAVFRDGSDYRFVGTGDCDDTDDLASPSSAVCPGATKFSVTCVLESSTMRCVVTPLDGPDAFVSSSSFTMPFSASSLMDTCVMFTSVSSPSTSSRMAINEKGLPGEKKPAVKKKPAAHRSAMQLTFENPYQQPGGEGAARLSMSDLSAPVGGFQAFISAVTSVGGGGGGAVSSSYAAGMYMPTPFSSGHFYQDGTPSSILAPDGTIRLAGGIATNQLLSMCNFALASISFTGTHGACVRLDFLPTYAGLDTTFYDDLGTAIPPMCLSSNVLVVDGVAPVCSVRHAEQGFFDLLAPSTPAVVSGQVEITFSAFDEMSGLQDITATMDVAPPGPGPEDIPMSVYHQTEDDFGAVCNVPASTPNGPLSVSIQCRDRSGNPLVTEIDLPALNTRTLDLSIALPGSHHSTGGAPPVEFTRYCDITLACDDGTVVSLGRDILFTNGLSILHLSAHDGVPLVTSGGSGTTPDWFVSVKDPLHTLRTTEEVTVSGSAMSSSVSLRGGNLNKDHRVDIGDYTVYAVRFGTTGSPSTPLPHAPSFRHADIDGDGVVDTPDFTFISSYFGTGFDDPLAGSPPRGGDRTVRTRISVKDAIAESGNDRRIPLLDLNGDGWITMQEIQAYLRRQG